MGRVANTAPNPPPSSSGLGNGKVTLLLLKCKSTFFILLLLVSGFEANKSFFLGSLIWSSHHSVLLSDRNDRETNSYKTRWK